ncbi:hypothetical protein FOZ60_010041 [Perkinsus olseni]|uniref:WD repeat-containing protein 19 n=1 Tax=Perkinsus olseni TaxID=32597 RepID=A0A7J6NGA4_PEROL|nr:hypothetical protein FOZ60_010041 [Perkinsus olseni]
MVLRQLLKLKEEYFGSGAVMFRWNTSASRLACVPAARPSNVFIFDSSGEIERDVPLDDRTSPVSSFEWDTTGNVLALIQKGVVTVSIYHFDEDRLETLDCSREEPSFIAWNMTGPQLAIGTSKGNTIIYNSTTAKMQLIAGKHGRRITCGAWTLRGHLLLGSDDKIISLSDTEGETLRQTVLRSAPMTMRVADEIIAGNAISFDKGGLSAKCCVRTGKDSLILLETEAMSIVATVKFSQKYGSIVDYGWFGDERLCIGYSGGQVVVTPTSGDEIGQEVFRCKPASSLDALSLCSIPSKAGGFSVLWAAVAGDGCIKIIDLRDCREETESTINYEDDDEAGVVSNLTFSRGGQTITFNVSTGCVYSYLARLPLMFEARGNSVAWLSSLREITVTEIVDGKQRSGKNAEKVKIECEVEPAIIGVGPRQIAAGAGRRVYYHSLRDGQKTEREYPAKVEAVELSQSHAAVLAEGKMWGSPAVTVLPAEGSKGDDGVKILSMRMTPQDILIYSTSGKELVHYDVEERCPINEYRHTESILAVYPNSLGGTYTAFLDAKGCCKSITLSLRGVLWDLADPSVFVVAADAREAAVLELHTFVVYDYSLSGPTVVPVGGAIRRSEVFYDSIDFESGRDDPTTLAHGEIPVAVQNGDIVVVNLERVMHMQIGLTANEIGRVTVQCRQPGELRTSDLASHSGIGSALRRMSNTNSGPVDVEEMERVVMRLAALGRMELAYRVCLSIPRKEKMGADEGGRDELMRLIARQAVELLEVDMAILAYRECGDADRVAFLDRLVQLEDVPMLQGYLKVLLGQKQMWESAKGLATTVDQRRLPMIHRHVAMGLEDKGDYEGALASYKEAIGRCLCYCGMYEPAARLCERIAEEDVLIECAAILERMKQYSLAGSALVILSEPVVFYIQDMDFDAAKPLMDQVSTPKLHLLYAKAKEARGFFKEAAASYEKGGDMESIVRLLVDESQLNDPTEGKWT